MTPEQRYLFDVTGYLHLENVLTGDTLGETKKRLTAISKPQRINCLPDLKSKGSINTASRSIVPRSLDPPPSDLANCQGIDP